MNISRDEIKQIRQDMRLILENHPIRFHVTDTGVQAITEGRYLHEIAPAVLAKPRPANKSLSDWRMALRRKLNGDTR